MSTDLAKAWELVQAGDVPGVMRHLRFTVEKLEIADVAQLVGRAADQVGFGDLAEASSALAADPEQPRALYDFGYACIERGVSFLAIPALTAAARRVPDSPVVLTELVAALEDEGRHREAVAVLEEREAVLRPWPDRYLLVYNSIMAGDLARAITHFGLLPVPQDQQWVPARDRVRRMLERADAVRAVSTLDDRDLRGWHFVLTGGVLSTMSPYGFAQGMTGRYAYQQDTFGLCRYGLLRLRLILEEAGRRPKTVSLLPERSSRILGLAAAEVLGLQTEEFAAGRPDTMVVAYDLTEVDGELLGGLRDRVPDQVLYEHVTCWTQPPAVTADVSTILCQTIVSPWGEQLRQVQDGSVQRGPADTRPVEELASEITHANPEPDPGDGETPDDPDGVLARFVTGTTGQWLNGPRDRIRSPGPVPSSRFL